VLYFLSKLIIQKEESVTKHLSTAAALVISGLAIVAVSSPAAADTCDQQTMLTRPISLGVSGGNINSFVKIHNQRECFGGTLGSLVQDSSSNQLILSNNHVLANTNKAKHGELIMQPGLIDTAPVCTKTPGDAVATFSRTVKIKFGKAKNTIDAALAAVKTGTVSADILNIGGIAGTVATPALGMTVQKMGRSTCLTSATVSAVGVNATVNYSATGGRKLANFVDQIVIGTSGFGEPGDSGSLIVTQDACPQAVALLFAGSSDGSMTIANPISAVLSGLSVTMVGSCAPAAPSDSALAASEGLSKEAVDSATAVRNRHEDELMSIQGAVGTGIGMGDRPGQPAIIVYVKKMASHTPPTTPKEVEGVQVKIIENGGFVAY
jgi:hypothetical protein